MSHLQLKFPVQLSPPPLKIKKVVHGVKKQERSPAPSLYVCVCVCVDLNLKVKFIQCVHKRLPKKKKKEKERYYVTACLETCKCISV